MQSNQLQSLDPTTISQPYRTTPMMKSNISPQGGEQALEVDFVVKNVYSKIKSLENKYIDLANYYKESAKGMEKSDSNKMAHNQVQPATQNIKESSMIRELYEKKKDLEENIQTLKAAVQMQKSDPSFQLGQIKQTKRVLGTVFAEIQNCVENAQTQCLKQLAQKQNEMFQLATKHKISSAFRNETLGLWYDTKSMLAQSFTEIKQIIVSQQHVSDQQLGLSFVYQPDKVQSSISQVQIQEINDYIYKFSRRQLKQKKEIAKIQASFDRNIQELQKDQQNLQALVDELSLIQEDSSLTRKKTVDKSVYLSPFQRKLQTYSNPALGQSVLNQQKRSASKGNNISQQTIQPTASAQNFQSKSSRAFTNEDESAKSPFSKQTKKFSLGQLDHLKSAIKVHGLANMQQQALYEDLLNLTQKITDEGTQFTQNLQSVVDQAMDKNQVDQSDRLQELQQQNEQIYTELRQLNDKYIDLRVENNKLRDQIYTSQNTRQNNLNTLSDQQQTSNTQTFQQHKEFLEQMCENVSRFMNAMRQLQKAVNRKDPDVAGPKEQFESQKQNLQALVVEVRELLNQRVTQTQQQQDQADSRKQTSSVSPLREKRPTVSSSQLNKLPLLLQNVKNLQFEKQKMQELIVELKQGHASELEQMQQKSKQKSERLQKFAAQCTFFQIKQQVQDQLLCDYRRMIIQLDSKLSDKIQSMEKQLELKIKEEVSRVQPNLRIDPQVLALRHDLINQIATQSQIQEGKIDDLNVQLKQKEEALNRLKLLFVEKLHELETTFVEISNEVAETEQHNQQQAQQKRAPNQFERSVETVLSKFESDEREKDIEQLTQANAELLEQIVHLKQALQLVDSQKKEHDPQVQAKLEFVFELQDQLDSQKSQLEKQIAKTKELEMSEAILKKEIQTLKYDNKRNQFDLKDARERFDKAKNEYQAQFNGLKMTILSQKQQVDKEQELRNAAQQSQQQLQKDISLLQTQKVLRETEIQNLQDELAQTKDQLQSCQAEAKNQQLELYEQIEDAQKEIEQLKLQIFELNNKSSIQIDPSETAEIVNSHMDILRKGTANEIQAGEFSEAQLIRLVNQLQEDWVQQQKYLREQSDLNTELGAQIIELKVELKETTTEALENQIKIDQLSKATEDSCSNLSLQAQLKESQSLFEFKQREIESMSERFGRVNQELGEYKSKANKLEESLNLVQQENRDLIGKLEAAERSNEAVQSDFESFQQQIKIQSEQLEKVNLKLAESNFTNEEIQAQLKNLNAKLILEREHKNDLENRLKLKESLFDKPSDSNSVNNTELIRKLTEAQNMLENVQSDYSMLKQSSEQRISEFQNQQEQTKNELTAKHKSELKSFLQKAVEDRKKIEKQYNEETAKLRSELEQLGQKLKICEEKLEVTQIQNQQFEQLVEKERASWDATEIEFKTSLAKAQTEIEQLRDTKNQIVAQLEEELRQAEEQRSDLHSKLSTDMQSQKQKDQQIIDELEAQLQKLRTAEEGYKQSLDQQVNTPSAISFDQKQFYLALALQNHSKKLITAKFEQLTLDFENQQVYTQNLERNSQQAEFKQLQQEGDLRRIEEEFKKYKADANKLMMENLKRQSELKKNDEAKNLQITSLLEYQSNLQDQIVDYANQIQKFEQENEKLLEHIQDLQTELNLKEQELKQQSPKKHGSSPEKQNLLERKIQELLDLNQKYEENINLIKAENEKLKKSGDEKRNSWEFQNSGGRGSWGSNGGNVISQDVEDVLKHIRQIMTTFLVKLPFSTKENEDILQILFSMLHFQTPELESLTQQREEFNKQHEQKQKGNESGKTLFGFGKKKQQKN